MRTLMTFIAVVAPILSCGAADLPPTIDEIAAFCASETLEQAATKAGALAWWPVPEAALEAWRKGFVAHHGREVVVRGWRQAERENANTMSFWIAAGPGGHTACSYTTASTGALLGAVSAHFGPPTSLDKSDVVTTAVWKRTGSEVSFSQIGTHAVLYVTRFNP